MRFLLQIVIAGIFLFGTLVPQAHAHGRAGDTHAMLSHASQVMDHAHHVEPSNGKDDRLSDCPARGSGKQGNSYSNACCPSSCFVDVVALHVPDFPGWKGLPTYQPMVAALTGQSRERLEHPPKH